MFHLRSSILTKSNACKGVHLNRNTARTRLSIKSATYVPRAMPFRLSSFDMTAMYIVALFWVNNAANAATGGVASFTYLFLGAMTFLLPCVITSAQLGWMFPHDGSLYHWTYKALGRAWAPLIGFLMCVAGLLAFVSSTRTFSTYVTSLNAH